MPSVSSGVRKHLDVIALNCVLLLIASALIVSARAVGQNSLDKHTAWHSTKDSLSRGLMGANTSVSDVRPVARNRLDLGAWYGFHEVLYTRALDVVEPRAAIGFERDGYVNVLYDVRAVLAAKNGTGILCGISCTLPHTGSGCSPRSSRPNCLPFFVCPKRRMDTQRSVIVVTQDLPHWLCMDACCPVASSERPVKGGRRHGRLVNWRRVSV